MSTLSVKHLEKWYGSRRILFDLNLNLDDGLYLIHGENGCGKSTLLSILAGSNRDYSGDIYLNDVNLKQEHKAFVSLVGYSPDSLDFFSEVTVKEFFAWVKGKRQMRTDVSLTELSQQFAFDHTSHNLLGDLSLGNAKKAMLLTALMTNSKLFLFDEPLNGLDTTGKQAFIEQIKTLSQHIVLIASHRSKDYDEAPISKIDFASLMCQE